MPERIYRRKEVEALFGLSRSTIYALMARGEFPRPVRISARAVGWPETALVRWQAQRAESIPQN